MKVSIIIPVYNAEKYITTAVESAIAQEQTGEVLLIVDGSPDKSLDICRSLEKKYKIVRVFTHNGFKNRGAAASRNLGIMNATFQYVTFLDADDYYLPNRFEMTEKIFQLDSKAEGIYEAIGTTFESKVQQKWWQVSGCPMLTSIHRDVTPDAVFERQKPIGTDGYCHLEGLTVRRKVFERTGLFDAELILHQDTAFFIKLAACARLVAGQVEVPVAMRRVHAQNRITEKRDNKETWNHRR
ncbi:glycosyltransferase, partial [candidate division KSB1 bacterium]|nr:glycosyltransferase [candidate division KSB1 bacterium]